MSRITARKSITHCSLVRLRFNEPQVLCLTYFVSASLIDFTHFALSPRLQVTATLGETTPSLDRDPRFAITYHDASHVTREQLAAALQQFRGQILQQPPAFSALKRGGRRASDLAAEGAGVVLAPRPVTVYRLELMEADGIELPQFHLGQGVATVSCWDQAQHFAFSARH